MKLDSTTIQISPVGNGFFVSYKVGKKFTQPEFVENAAALSVWLNRLVGHDAPTSDAELETA